MKVFLVTPYKIDIDFNMKKSIVSSIFKKNGIELLIAEDNITSESLSAIATIELFYKSDFFIVDISYSRPSCYYELGYLQALKKQLFIISQNGETIHQLLNRDEIKFYNNLDEYKLYIENIVLTIKNL